MITGSILAQIAYYLFTTERSILNNFLITGPFYLGGFLIVHAIRYYRRRDQIAPEESLPTLFTRGFFYSIFINVAIFGTAIYLLLIATDLLLMLISALTAFFSIIPLNYFLRRYFQSISSIINKEFLKKMKKFVYLGLLGALILFFVIFILYLGEFPIPINTVGASLLLLLEIFIVLYYIIKYLYNQKMGLR